ncbi:MAG: FCD domain-containing protein [Pseudonocardia sp.]|nr:FCD domain-containing protein [Pseudonocardia sp.]
MSNDERIFELKLDPGRALPDVIADKVRALIDSGHYRPGGRLDNESELARTMRVARSSVRTALQRLETLEVLEVRRGRGWYVRRTPPPSATGSGLFEVGKYRISELFELRIGLEGLAASLAAVRATDGEIDDLRKLNREHQEAGADQARLLETDEAFHGLLVTAGHNKMLIDAYVPIVGRLREWRYDSFANRGVPLRSGREHSKIVRYLDNHDPGGARAAMNSHLQRLYDELPDIADEPLDLTTTLSDSEPHWTDHQQ